MSGRHRGPLAALGIVTLLAYVATGWQVVAPGEVAVVRRFGRALRTPLPPGPHLILPYGLDRVTRVRTDDVRRLAVGFAENPGAMQDPGAGEFLTGDLNIVRAEATVQYRVADPVRFALLRPGVEPFLMRLAESSLASALAGQGIDATLSEGRAAVAVRTRESLQEAARRYDLGIAVLGVDLTAARPPGEVAPEFAAAQSARSDRDRRITEAETRAATALTTSKANAQALLEHARARDDRTLGLAKARAGKFLAILEESKKSPKLGTRRLYLEAMRDLLGKVRRKIVLAPDEPIDLSVLGIPSGP